VPIDSTTEGAPRENPGIVQKGQSQKAGVGCSPLPPPSRVEGPTSGAKKQNHDVQSVYHFLTFSAHSSGLNGIPGQIAADCSFCI